MTESLTQRLKQYVNEKFVDEDEVLQFVRHNTEIKGLPQINLAPNEGKVLQLLVMLCGAEKVVEVGTLAGYSGIWIARGLPSSGRLITIEKSSVHASLARRHFERAGLAGKVTVMQGEGLDVLRKLADQAPFDLIFIDADKANYPNYLNWAAVNLRVGGALLADNAFWGGKIFAPESADDHGLAQFNRALAEHPRFQSSILEVGDGIALGVKVS